MPAEPEERPIPDPDAIAAHAFTKVRKGYEVDEVRAYLVSLASQVREAQRLEADASRRLAELERRAADPDELDETRLTQLLGEETARVLETARQAATDLRARAADEAAQTVATADEQAAATRASADEYASTSRAAADEYAAGTRTAADLLSKRLPPGAVHQYVPLDAPRWIERFLSHWQPDLAVVAESEIWPNTVVALHERGIPLVLVNGRMPERSFRAWTFWSFSLRSWMRWTTNRLSSSSCFSPGPRTPIPPL